MSEQNVETIEFENNAPPPGQFREFWGYFKENKGAVAGLIYIVTVVFLAIFADQVTPHDPFEQYRDHILTPPAWQEGGLSQFPLGTDEVGRDMVTRLIHGARLSLFIGCIVVTLSLAVGILAGLVAGYFRGIVDTAIMRVVDIIMALPSLLLCRFLGRRS